MKCIGLLSLWPFLDNCNTQSFMEARSCPSVVCLFGSKYAMVSGMVIADFSFLNAFFVVVVVVVVVCLFFRCSI